MDYIGIFDVIGPNMIGPSSSHTAGAVSMALLARKMFGREITKVTFVLYGSFAKTYCGHGTDKALLGGILGFATDDERICDAFQIAEGLGLQYEIMEHATHNPLENPQKSIGGLIGGEAKAVADYAKTKKPICGDALSKAIAYAMAVLEVNASMGLIVAAPTAGSSGIVPGTLLAVKETYGLSEETLKSGLYHASAIGYLLMRNASVSGAEAGCQSCNLKPAWPRV